MSAHLRDPAAGPDRGRVALVADPEPSMRRIMRCILQTRGYQSIEATLGEVFARSRAEHVAIVTLSVGGEGDVLSDATRLQDAGPKVLVIGWMDEVARLGRALECGADEYLIKPFTAAEACSRLDLLFAKPDPSVVNLNTGAVELTEEEHRALLALEEKAGRIATFRQVAKRIWGEATSRADEARAVMTALRRKMELIEPRPYVIKAELGMGYRLVGPATSPRSGGAALERRRAYDSSDAGS